MVEDGSHVIFCFFSTACGTTIVTDNDGGAIASPRYPAPYPPNQNCSWIIRAQEPCEFALVCPQTWETCCFVYNVMHKMLCFFNFRLFCLWPVNHVTLSFTDFELEMISSNCSHDAVKILDGDNYQAPSIGSYTVCVCVCACVFTKAYAVDNDQVRYKLTRHCMWWHHSWIWLNVSSHQLLWAISEIMCNLKF